MARLSSFHACLLFCALRICSVNGVDLDKHLQQLKENYVNILLTQVNPSLQDYTSYFGLNVRKF